MTTIHDLRSEVEGMAHWPACMLHPQHKRNDGNQICKCKRGRILTTLDAAEKYLHDINECHKNGMHGEAHIKLVSFLLGNTEESSND